MHRVTDDSLRWLAPKPATSEPVLIAMLTGWIDAGGAGRSALEVIEQESSATPIAEFDDDVYVDYRARRPVMELREGLNSVLTWERIQLLHGTDRTGRDLLLLAGPEPDTAWHRFSGLMGALATDLGVRHFVHFGAYPFAVPHTRTPRLSVSSPSHDVLATVPFLRSSIDVPAGIAAALEHEMHGRGVPALGIWAQVPHYIASLSYPAASIALLDGLRETTGVVVDAAELRNDVIAQGRRIDAMVTNNDEHVEMIEQLERIYDATAEERTIGTSSLEMTSGDELAAELEQFLRDQD